MERLVDDNDALLRSIRFDASDDVDEFIFYEDDIPSRYYRSINIQ